uniref:Uncharacterized protein n=1 Tax=Nothobranchius furzeri TaxID=105023 RepID=A0A8C6M9V8_NOTFU
KGPDVVDHTDESIEFGKIVVTLVNDSKFFFIFSSYNSVMEIEDEITCILLELERQKVLSIADHLKDVIGVQQKSELLLVEAEDLKHVLTPIQIPAFKKCLCKFCIPLKDLNDTITLDLYSAVSEETSTQSSWVSDFQIPWQRFPFRLSQAITCGVRAHPEGRRSMVRIVVEVMQVHCKTPKRSACEEIVNFTDKGERLGPGHYSLLRSIKCRVEHVNQDDVTHRLRRPKRTRNEEDCSPERDDTSNVLRHLVDSYGCINWQPVQLPEGETQAPLEGKKNRLLAIFSSQGPEAVERPELEDLLLLTYISQHHHFERLAGIEICERLSQALITKGRRILNYFSSQKLKCNLGIRNVIQEIEDEGVLTNNKVGTAAILLMKYYNENEDSLFLLADVNFFFSDNSRINAVLFFSVSLIYLVRSLLTATCWMVSSERHIIFELHTANGFADAPSVFYGSFYVLNLEYQEAACATLELTQRFFVGINPEEGTKCTSKFGTSRKTGTSVKRKVVHINPLDTTFLQRLTEFEWKTSN